MSAGRAGAEEESHFESRLVQKAIPRRIRDWGDCPDAVMCCRTMQCMRRSIVGLARLVQLTRDVIWPRADEMSTFGFSKEGER